MTGFQAAFARALGAPDDTHDVHDTHDTHDVHEAHEADMRLLTRQPAFAVYRNTVATGCIDALEANFPAVAQLVGRDWFRSAAAGYAAMHRPVDASLLDYGDDGFGTWLQALPTAADLGYLAGVAQLDTLWRASYAAADAAVLPRGALAAVPPDRLGEVALRLHPAVRWACFAELPVSALWLRTREGSAPDDIAWHGDALLLTRPAGAVQAELFDAAGCAFLDACAAGHSLAQAASAALQVDPAADVAALLNQLLRSGAFQDFSSQERT